VDFCVSVRLDFLLLQTEKHRCCLSLSGFRNNDGYMKTILLFGAGKSATVLIDYLKMQVAERNWRFILADADLQMARQKLGDCTAGEAVGVSVENAADRAALIGSADVVISLLPPQLHGLVAADCLAIGRHLLTASYVDDTMRGMAGAIAEKNLLFLCEMGLDPGIDHMSAMQLIHRIKAGGNRIISFASHCGGLITPESDNNPWHYKISWNPRNVVHAGKAGAVFREKSKVKSQKYLEVFTENFDVDIEGFGKLSAYANRDSLSYIPLYKLEETESFIRTTLRYPGFCEGWEIMIKAGFTSEEHLVDTTGLSLQEFFTSHFEKASIAFNRLSEDQQKQFLFLGADNNRLINKGKCTSAAILQWILEEKLALQSGDADMVAMQHEILYTSAINPAKQKAISTLVVKGEDNVHTAMAKTVGLPLGIAAILLLEDQIAVRGLQIPVVPEIYEPVLTQLEKAGVAFHETVTEG
jgi:saccharopine dehydrogenase-like NADP-dependent oxidoreductase